jgi:hypothetical protein
VAPGRRLLPPPRAVCQAGPGRPCCQPSAPRHSPAPCCPPMPRCYCCHTRPDGRRQHDEQGTRTQHDHGCPCARVRGIDTPRFFQAAVHTVCARVLVFACLLATQPPLLHAFAPAGTCAQSMPPDARCTSKQHVSNLLERPVQASVPHKCVVAVAGGWAARMIGQTLIRASLNALVAAVVALVYGGPLSTQLCSCHHSLIC